MEIIVGTYEEFLIGYQLQSSEGSYELRQSVATRAHSGSIRDISCCPKYMASGSNDEVVRIFNMRRRNDCGTLVQHSGSVTNLHFFGNSHLFTASEDGTICVWQTKNWVCEKTLRGHKDAVLAISIHPSGKLLLSVSKDKTLRTWNLIKGRCAYVTNLKAVAHIVLWSPSSTFFAIVVDKRVDIYDITIGGIVHNIDFGKRVNCIAFLNNDTIIIGGDGNELQIYSIQKKCIINSFNAHSNRLKSIACVTNYPDIKENKIWIVSISSDSYIKLWEFDLLKLNSDPLLIASVNTTCRLTCLTIWITDQKLDQIKNISEMVGSQEKNTNKTIKKRKNKSKENKANKKTFEEKLE